MAGGMDLGGGGQGKKPLDTNINLVPFIDLMAVTIVFLIMTAVWTQLGRLQVSQAGSSAEPAPDVTPPPMPVAVLLTEKTLTLTVGGVPLATLPVTRDQGGRLQLDALGKKLSDVKKELPDQNAVTLTTEDSVRYDDLVRVIDLCVGGPFPSVSISPAT